MSEDTWIAKTIVPNSQQLNADDLTAGPITITVTDVRQGEADQPVCICSDGRQPYKPCKTMRRLLVSLWGDKASEWVGKRLTLYADPSVKWGGVAVGGIRISHVSGIDQPHTVMVTETRGKRKAMTVHPLPDAQPPKPKPAAQTPPDAFLDHWRNEAKKLRKPSLPIAKAIADAYQAHEDQRDSMLDEAAQLAESDSVPPEDQVLLKSFCKAVFNEWTK